MEKRNLIPGYTECSKCKKYLELPIESGGCDCYPGYPSYPPEDDIMVRFKRAGHIDSQGNIHYEKGKFCNDPDNVHDLDLDLDY